MDTLTYSALEMKEMEMRTLTAIILGEADAHIRLAITCWGIIYCRSYNRYDFPPKFLRFCPKYQHLVMMFKKDDDQWWLTDHSGCQCRGYQVHQWSWWLRLKRRHLPRIISPKLLQVFVRANIQKNHQLFLICSYLRQEVNNAGWDRP